MCTTTRRSARIASKPDNLYNHKPTRCSKFWAGKRHRIPPTPLAQCYLQPLARPCHNLFKVDSLHPLLTPQAPICWSKKLVKVLSLVRMRLDCWKASRKYGVDPQGRPFGTTKSPLVCFFFGNPVRSEGRDYDDDWEEVLNPKMNSAAFGWNQDGLRTERRIWVGWTCQVHWSLCSPTWFKSFWRGLF